MLARVEDAELRNNRFVAKARHKFVRRLKQSKVQ